MGNPNTDGDLIDTQEAAFHILGELGEGGVGEILLAHESALQRDVAFKFLKPKMMGNVDVVKRFLTEACIIAQLDHPAIIPVYRVSTTKDGRIGYTMKPILGATLTDLIKESKQQLNQQGKADTSHDLQALLEHFVKVCDAVHFAHSKDIIHRDLKPSNVMIGPYNEVYVVDWGISKSAKELVELRAIVDDLPMESEELSERTRVGTIMGTPRYMAPEQASGNPQSMDARSDLFSLGLMLFEITSLRPAFRGRNWGELKNKIIEAQLEPLVHYARNSHIPVELRAIIEKATQKKPQDRYASVTNFATDIRRYLKGEAVSVHQDSLAQKAMRWMIHHKQAALGLFASLLVVSTLVIGLSFYQQQQERLQAQAEQLYMGRFLTAVGNKTQDIERRFFRFEAMLENLAGSATQLLQHGKASAERYYTSDDNYTGEGAPDLSMSAAYGIPISLGWPAIKPAPDVHISVVDEIMGRLAPLRGTFEQIFRSSLGLENSSLKSYIKEMMEKGSPLVWAYVGTESGIHVAYPGKSGYPVAFDPRIRPWYVQSLSRKGIEWQPPYVDVGGRGLMLASTLALYGDDGALLGVAGVEMALEDLRQQLLGMSLSGTQATTYLLDSDGRIITSSIDEVAKFSVGTLINQRLDLPLYKHAQVVRKIQQGVTGHHVVQDGESKTLVAFYHIESVGWYFVVESPFSGHTSH